MRKFVAESRPLVTDGKRLMSLSLVVDGVNRLPRKMKKKIKSMAKRISTVEMLNYIVESKD